MDAKSKQAKMVAFIRRKRRLGLTFTEAVKEWNRLLKAQPQRR